MQEKRRTRKALDLKKSSDLQCHHLREQAAKLQSEVTSLRSQLKEATSHAHQLEMAEAQMREEFERERAELEREQGSSERESTGLRRLLESTQQQMKKEVDLRHQVEQDAAKAKKGLSLFSHPLSLSLSLSLSPVHVCVWSLFTQDLSCVCVCVCDLSLLPANLLLKEIQFLGQSQGWSN